MWMKKFILLLSFWGRHMHDSYWGITGDYDVTLVQPENRPSFVVTFDHEGNVFYREILGVAPVRIHRSEKNGEMSMTLTVSKQWVKDCVPNPMRMHNAFEKVKMVLGEMGFPEFILRDAK